MAYDGEIPQLTLADLVPISDRSRVRQRDLAGYVIRSDDSTAEDPTDPRSERWWLRALDELSSGSTRQIAAMSLEDKIDRARERSRNLKSSVMHDFRVGAKIAKQACLALCQFASRYGAQQVTTEALTDAHAKVKRMEQEISRLRDNLNIAENSRRYLLQRKKTSKDSSPNGDPAPLGRNTKRSVHDRREVSPVRSPSYEWAVMDEAPPPYYSRGDDGESGGGGSKSVPIPHGPIRGGGPPSYGGLPRHRPVS